MPVQTRSAKKRQAAAEVNPPRPLVSDSTIVEITVSDTGEGKHTRWIRPKEGPVEQDDISAAYGNDPRSKTPTPPDISSLAKNNAKRPLASDKTIIEITVSETREDQQIRWIRPSRNPGAPEEVISPDLNNDPRFKTPAPPEMPTSPPRLQRRSQLPKTPMQTPSCKKIRLHLEKNEVDEILLRSCGRNLYYEFARLLGPTVAPLPPRAQDLGSPLYNGDHSESRWLADFRSRPQGLETPLRKGLTGA
ncbi:hypothetical protein CPB84DRAFT_1767089 [Gymnopilus junonius]|uniref:Uncharacterized protein n=1 Tax=Gymnopilus junonius TaxID=109634 RepID=A0A9P5TS45_GYMJU|nr:hypothetical protein CPB84DRAFT_1767089 [Gymnopilus junonius]